jgi:hypothetical protein
MTILELRNSFNGSSCMTADQLAQALGKQPGRAWQQDLARALKGCGIVPGRTRINGKRVRAYRRDDFEADDQGRVRDSPELFNHEKKRIEAEVNRLEVKSVLRELNRVADSIEQDEPNAKRSDLPG